MPPLSLPGEGARRLFHSLRDAAAAVPAQRRPGAAAPAKGGGGGRAAGATNLAPVHRHLCCYAWLYSEGLAVALHHLGLGWSV